MADGVLMTVHIINHHLFIIQCTGKVLYVFYVYIFSMPISSILDVDLPTVDRTPD